MTGIDISAALAAANPVSDRAAARLPLEEAEADLVGRIVTTPVPARRPRVQTGSLLRRRLVPLLAITAAAAALLALLPPGNRDGGPPPAFAAPLVRFANASPLVLLQLPGWHVVYANEEVGGYGEMHFVRGPADADGTPRGASFRDQASLAGRVASLDWTSGTAARPPYRAGGHRSLPTGLGVTVHRLVYEGGSRRAFDITASFVDHGRLLNFRATVTDMAMFRAELRALHRADTTTWLEAMPPSVVKAANSSQTIRAMLRGIPLPPGFDAARIRGARLVHDRYQLGAAVTGTVACMWIADWNRARATGDTAMIKRAIAAMATAPHWPILHEMASQGAWAQVLISDAKAMPAGKVKLDAGRPGLPLTQDANSGLGCASEWGIELGPGPR